MAFQQFDANDNGIDTVLNNAIAFSFDAAGSNLQFNCFNNSIVFGSSNSQVGNTADLYLSRAQSGTLNVSNSSTLGSTGIVQAAQHLAITGTITASSPGLSVTQTWNNVATTFTGIFANITNTNSASGSLLMDLQVGGTSKCSIDKTGSILNATIDASQATKAPTVKLNAIAATPGNPATTTSTTMVMCGFAVAFTPRTTGRALVIAQVGAAENSVINDGFKTQAYFGTGTAPVNGAALTGTAIGANATFGTAIAAGGSANIGLSVSGVASGLVVNTAYWFDLAYASITGGTTSFQFITYTIIEI